MYWILFQCDAGLKSQAYKECMRPWSNAVLHMSRTQFNTHVKFGVDWFHLERLRCSLRLPSRSSLESNQTHIEIKPPGAPFWHYLKNRWPTRSLLFCVRFRLNKVRRLTQICVLLLFESTQTVIRFGSSDIRRLTRALEALLAPRNLAVFESQFESQNATNYSSLQRSINVCGHFVFSAMTSLRKVGCNRKNAETRRQRRFSVWVY